MIIIFTQKTIYLRYIITLETINDILQTQLECIMLTIRHTLRTCLVIIIVCTPLVIVATNERNYNSNYYVFVITHTAK